MDVFFSMPTSWFVVRVGSMGSFEPINYWEVESNPIDILGESCLGVKSADIWEDL